jgi:hypothetical protein
MEVSPESSARARAACVRAIPPCSGPCAQLPLPCRHRQGCGRPLKRPANWIAASHLRAHQGCLAEDVRAGLLRVVTCAASTVTRRTFPCSATALCVSCVFIRSAKHPKATFWTCSRHTPLQDCVRADAPLNISSQAPPTSINTFRHGTSVMTTSTARANIYTRPN